MTASTPQRWIETLRAAFPSGRFRNIVIAVTDQGLVSSGTFLLNVLLARFTAPPDYGVFVLCFSGIVFSIQLQSALVIEPMMVFGSSQPEHSKSRYLRAALMLQLIFTGTLMATVWLACTVWWSIGGPSRALFTLAAAALGLLGIHAREFVRKAFYTSFAPDKALANDTLYLLLLLSGLTLVIWQGELTGAIAFAILAIAGMGSALVGLLRSGGPVVFKRADILEAASIHWAYGKWMIGVSGARWSANELYYFVAAALVGTAGSGALKAVQNVFAPVSMFLMGLANLLLPATARLARTPRRTSLNRFVVVIGAVLGPAVAVYLAAAYIGTEWVFGLLYGGAYIEYAYLLPIVGAGHVLVAAFQGPSLGLRALDRPKAIFAITTISAAATVVAVVPMTAAWGLAGAAGAVLLSLLISSPLWAMHYVRAART